MKFVRWSGDIHYLEKRSKNENFRDDTGSKRSKKIVSKRMAQSAPGENCGVSKSLLVQGCRKGKTGGDEYAKVEVTMVSDFLLEGKQNAQTAKYLCQQMNLTLRELTKTIEAERRSGIPICASTGKTSGYYIAATKQEMEEYCEDLKHRAIEIFKTRQACKKTIENL